MSATLIKKIENEEGDLAAKIFHLAGSQKQYCVWFIDQEADEVLDTKFRTDDFAKAEAKALEFTNSSL